MSDLSEQELDLEVVSIMVANVTVEAAMTDMERKINFRRKAVKEPEHEIVVLKDQMKACETIESSKTPVKLSSQAKLLLSKLAIKEKLCCRKIKHNSPSLSPPYQSNNYRI